MFSTTSGDGSRLTIDGNVVVDNWGIHGRRRREKLVELNEGWHNVVAEQFSCGSCEPVLNVSYRGDDTDDKELLISEHIYHGKTDATKNVNPPETIHTSESNPGGNDTSNININSIGGASATPVVAPFLEGPMGGSGAPTGTGTFP